MFKEQITNANVMSIDFSRRERRAFLQSIPVMKKHKAVLLAPDLYARGVWSNDVSSMDRRSVKAHLAGRGDFRVLRWKIICIRHQILKPTTIPMLLAFEHCLRQLTANWFNYIKGIYIAVRTQV